jgi:hypothetical protein
MDIDDLKVDNHAPIISDNAVESILKEIAVRNPLWTAMTKNLLATEPDSIAKVWISSQKVPEKGSQTAR